MNAWRYCASNRSDCGICMKSVECWRKSWSGVARCLLSMLRVTLGYYDIYGVARPGSVPFPVVLAGIDSWL
jgi:hypothetical protein